MTSGDEAPPARKPDGNRAERLAAALKQNLKKRKAQARARRRGEGLGAPEPQVKRDDSKG